MAKRLSVSNQHLSLENIAEVYHYRCKSLQLFFSEENPKFSLVFAGLLSEEVHFLKGEQISEAEKDACLNLLAGIEAKFRLDYSYRCERKLKDPLSKQMRMLFQRYLYHCPLDQGIFNLWKSSGLVSPALISEIKGAFHYRHWLAHGRYWTYKSIKYDFDGLYYLSKQVDKLPLTSED
ncbi:hypothetical protein [Persicobacter sp. CCB-QB2]|uniref:hypothetical protein n=1 Tax=Persicobacter sp. CCB-QB2 TaxID=1561025 RepID=UPI0006A94AC4|nr:hypothetical protein [Persicobacter sp. CCB-QB2]